MDPIPTDIVVIYHANCRDGISSAYAAWKKFGDRATYIPRKTQLPPPEGLTNKEVYILDCSYSKDTLTELERTNTKVVVLDHHQSAEEAVRAFPQNVFDLEHSGATLSWTYFHPETPLPRIFRYVEEHDLWKNELPDSGAVAAAIGMYDFTLESWDQLVARTEDDKEFAAFVEQGRTLREYIDRHVAELATFAELVQFEGHEVYAVNCSRPFRTAVGNLLATKHPPFSIVWYRSDGAYNVSLRSIDDFDVGSLAQKYGGGGHRGSAGMKFKHFEDLPFSFPS